MADPRRDSPFGRTPPRRHYAMWMLTGACPSHCTYCDIDSQRGKKALSAEEVERVAHEIVDAGFREVLFAGGEPVLSPELPVALRVLQGRVPTAVFTGGLPGLAERAVTVLRDGRVDRIVFSIDAGDPARNDLLRGRTGITSDLLELAGAVRDGLPGIGRSVNTVVSRFNVEILEGVWERMSPFRLDSWSLTLAGDFFQGNPRHAFLTRAMLEAFYLRTVPALAQRLARERAQLVVLPVPYPLLKARLPPSRWGDPPASLRAELDAELPLYERGEYNATFVRKHGCPLVGIDMVVGIGGEIHPCSQPPIIHPDYVVGSVKTQSVASVLSSDALGTFAASVPQRPCTRCWAPSNIPSDTLLRLVH